MQAIYKLSALVLAATLVACGGGGGGGGGGSTGGSVTPGPIVVAPPVVPVVDSAIVTSVPVATYAAGSPQAAVYSTLNTERQRCGFGLLAQNAALDKSSAAHAAYLIANKTSGHTEIVGKPGFTGVSPDDRAKIAGYLGWAGEVVGAEVPNVNPWTADTAETTKALFPFRGLMGAPYHLVGMIDGYRDVGISYDSPGLLVGVFGIQSGKYKQADDSVRTYPCDGTQDTAASLNSENPNPFPNEPGAIWGQPIVVKGKMGMTVSSATVTGPVGSIPVKVIYGNGGVVDPNGYFTSTSGTVAVIPSALKTNSTYSVVINGSNNGTAFTKSFSFSTGQFFYSGRYPTGQF